MYHVFKNSGGQISIIKASLSPRFKRVLSFHRKHSVQEVQVDKLDVSRMTNVDIVDGQIVYLEPKE